MSLKAMYEDVPSDAHYYFANYADSHFLRHTTAHYDPIFTPLFTAILGSATIAGTTITWASVAAAIATTALSIGIQMLMAPKPPKAEAARVPLTQAIPYRSWGVGRTRLAGAYMLWESRGPSLFAIQAIVGHRVRSFNRFWLHDDEVMINGSGIANSPTGRYRDEVTILYRLGLPTETAYANAVSLFSSTGLWTNDHRGDGQASICMRAVAQKQKEQQKIFPYGVPVLSTEVDLALCWDFRDPDQDPTDPSTWTWTQNCALICAWHLCFNEFGFNLDYTKALLPVLDLWIEEADICDENVPLAGGGTEKRYQCNGSDTTENGPKSGLNAILSACDGHLVARGDGARILTVGKFRESRCATLTDADIIGHNIQYDVLFEEEVNRLVPKFTYPATDYTSCDTDYFEDVDAQLSAGRVLSEEANYQWVHQWRQARRLGKRDWLRIRQKVKGSLDVRLSGINAVYARWVRLETPMRLPRLDGKIVENRRSVIALTRNGFTIDLIQHPESIDDWNPSVDEGAQPPVPIAPGATAIEIPVINLVQARANGSSVYIRVIVLEPADSSLTPVVRYRVADTGLGIPGAWVTQSFADAEPVLGFINMNTSVVPSGVLLDIQVGYVTGGGAAGEFSTTANVTSTVDATAPGTPVNMTAPNSVTTVPVSAKAANDNTRRLIFKRGTTVQSFAAATVIGDYAVTANQTISFNDVPGVGTWKYWCGAENISGVPSVAQASATAVVT